MMSARKWVSFLGVALVLTAQVAYGEAGVRTAVEVATATDTGVAISLFRPGMSQAQFVTAVGARAGASQWLVANAAAVYRDLAVARNGITAGTVDVAGLQRFLASNRLTPTQFAQVLGRLETGNLPVNETNLAAQATFAQSLITATNSAVATNIGPVRQEVAQAQAVGADGQRRSLIAGFQATCRSGKDAICAYVTNTVIPYLTTGTSAFKITAREKAAAVIARAQRPCTRVASWTGCATAKLQLATATLAVMGMFYATPAQAIHANNTAIVQERWMGTTEQRTADNQVMEFPNPTGLATGALHQLENTFEHPEVRTVGSLCATGCEVANDAGACNLAAATSTAAAR